MSHGETYQVEDGWIEIWPGKQFRFNDPSSNVMEPESIAHALSMLCRYNGHTRRFYSVCEHTCLISDWVMGQSWATARDGLTALHHDDAEYIIGDLARPVKVTMPQFKALETRIDEAVARQFGTIYPLPSWLKQLDARMIRDERPAVMVPSGLDWGTDGLEPMGVRFWTWTGRWAWLTKRRWLRRHYKLTRLMEMELRTGAGLG